MSLIAICLILFLLSFMYTRHSYKDAREYEKRMKERRKKAEEPSELPKPPSSLV